MEKKIIFLVPVLTLTLAFFIYAEEETFTITTYYPSPYGSYNELTTYSNAYLAIKSGNVGIGTSRPAAKLDVSGTVKASGFRLGDTAPSGYVLTTDTTGVGTWQAVSGWAPSDVKMTNATHSGNFGSYQAMHNWIQANGCDGYHVCDVIEMTRYAQQHDTSSLSGYINAGVIEENSVSSMTCREPPSVSSRTEQTTDCKGWTSFGYDSGWGWKNGQITRYSYCRSPWTVLCCK